MKEIKQDPEFKKRREYITPIIELEDDLSSDALLHFGFTSYGNQNQCGDGCVPD